MAQLYSSALYFTDPHAEPTLATALFRSGEFAPIAAEPAGIQTFLQNIRLRRSRALIGETPPPAPELFLPRLAAAIFFTAERFELQTGLAACLALLGYFR